MEDDLNFLKMEDDLYFFENGRQPQKTLCSQKQLKLNKKMKMEDDLKKNNEYLSACFYPILS